MPTQKKMPIEERYVYLQVQYERYRLANRRTKGALLAEMVAVTGMHIKSLTRLMNGPPPCRHPRQRQRERRGNRRQAEHRLRSRLQGTSCRGAR